MGTIETQIQRKLQEGLQAIHLEIVNESNMHGKHTDAESHFAVHVVSADFEGMSLLDRQRKVHALLSHELSSQIHALRLKTMTPSEWEASGQTRQDPAPACRGGSLPSRIRLRTQS